MKTIRDEFVAEIQKRFSFVFDMRDQKFDKIFIIATFLDPNYCWLMEEMDEFTAKGLLKSNVIN